MNDLERHEAALKEKLHNLQVLLSYHTRNERKLLNRLDEANVSSIYAEFGPLLSLSHDILYYLDIGSTREKLQAVVLEVLRVKLGSRTESGELSERVNLRFSGIIDRMEEDYPAFGPMEKNLYCCMLLGVSDRLLKDVFELGSSNATAKAKFKLVKSIKALRSNKRLKYLRLLEKKDCAYGKKMLSLHNLIKKRNEKDKD